jgi:AcrR family transcriptional regulator
MSRIDAVVLGAPSAGSALQAMFMAHTAFVSEHPGVPRLLFGELQRAGSTTPKRLVAALLREYAERLRTLLERGRDSGELDAHVDIEAAATLFVGSIQGLVIQALFAGDVQAIQRNAPGVFATYLRGISRGTP